MKGAASSWLLANSARASMVIGNYVFAKASYIVLSSLSLSFFVFAKASYIVLCQG